MKAHASRRWITLACVVCTAVLLPRWWLGREAEALYRGELKVQDRLARGVIHALDHAPRPRTGDPLFDAEWSMGTDQMAILGLGQLLLAHPGRQELYLPPIRRAADRLVSPGSLRFGAERWQADPLAIEPSGEGHAYLGYAALALGMVRLVDPGTPHAALHDRWIAALAARLDRAPHGVFETYPGETYPPDVFSVAAAIGLHARVTGADHRALLDRWSNTMRARWIHPSGYLVQHADARSGQPLGPPRGSGTAIAAYFASFVDPGLAATLHSGLRSHGHTTLLGFGAIREDAPGRSGSTDIDSGPVVFGVSVAATGFALASARIHHDRELYVSLARTAWLFGVPVHDEHGQHFLTGGTIGNAILLAMLTAGAP